jgi:hypothetical protein
MKEIHGKGALRLNGDAVRQVREDGQDALDRSQDIAALESIIIERALVKTNNG